MINYKGEGTTLQSVKQVSSCNCKKVKETGLRSGPFPSVTTDKIKKELEVNWRKVMNEQSYNGGSCA